MEKNVENNARRMALNVFLITLVVLLFVGGVLFYMFMEKEYLSRIHDLENKVNDTTEIVDEKTMVNNPVVKFSSQIKCYYDVPGFSEKDFALEAKLYGGEDVNIVNGSYHDCGMSIIGNGYRLFMTFQSEAFGMTLSADDMSEFESFSVESLDVNGGELYRREVSLSDYVVNASHSGLYNDRLKDFYDDYAYHFAYVSNLTREGCDSVVIGDFDGYGCSNEFVLFDNNMLDIRCSVNELEDVKLCDALLEEISFVSIEE